MATPQGVRYEWQPSQIEYQLFPEAYFSGADVTLYFGDTWVDDISALSFVLAERVQPIYGYRSHIYDEVARGSRIVQGSFRIPFREAGYLYTILDHIAGLHDMRPRLAYMLAGETAPPWMALAKQRIEEVLDYYHAPKQGTTREYSWPTLKLGSRGPAVKELQQRLQELGYFSRGQETTEYFGPITEKAVKAFQLANGLKPDGVVGSATRQALSPLGTSKAGTPVRTDLTSEARMSELEKQIWGRDFGYYDRSHQSYFYGDEKHAIFRQRGFDIYIVYGPLPDQVAQPPGRLPEGVTYNTTVKAVRGVQLTAVGQNLDPSGRPVEEVYQFIARDLD